MQFIHASIFGILLASSHCAVVLADASVPDRRDALLAFVTQTDFVHTGLAELESSRAQLRYTRDVSETFAKQLVNDDPTQDFIESRRDQFQRQFASLDASATRLTERAPGVYRVLVSPPFDVPEPTVGEWCYEGSIGLGSDDRIRYLAAMCRAEPKFRSVMRRRMLALVVEDACRAPWFRDRWVKPNNKDMRDRVDALNELTRTTRHGLYELRRASGLDVTGNQISIPELEFRECAEAWLISRDEQEHDGTRGRKVAFDEIIALGAGAAADGKISVELFGASHARDAAVLSPGRWLNNEAEKANADAMLAIHTNSLDRDLDLLDRIREEKAATKAELGQIRVDLDKLEQRMIERIWQEVQTLSNRIDFEVRSLKQEIAVVREDVKVLTKDIRKLEHRVASIEARTPGHGRPLPDLEGAREDADADEIDDRWERALIDMFAPVIIADRPSDIPDERIGVPIDPTQFFRDCRVINGDGKNPNIVKDDPDRQWLEDINKSDPRASAGYRLQFKNEAARWGSGWNSAIRDNAGVYARVWRPFGKPEFGKQSIVSVQYFVLLTCNISETSKPFISDRTGYHDGDVLCLDFGVDISEPLTPFIVHAVYHNHGRQWFLKPAALQYARGMLDPSQHPLVFLERGSNEPWPNQGGGGEDGWPDRDGAATNKRFYKSVDARVFEKKVMDEDQVVSSHWGEAQPWYTSHKIIPNLGETDGKGTILPLKWGRPEEKDDDRYLLLTYAGAWGSAHVDAEIDILVHQWHIKTGPPQGPSQQGYMWNRTDDDWNGPWAASSDANLTEGFKLIARKGRKF